MKRGRPRLPDSQRRGVRVSIAVTADVADAAFVYARRKREPLSLILGRLLEKLAQRERELSAYQKSESGWPLTR
jgi:hypothetical protein